MSNAPPESALSILNQLLRNVTIIIINNMNIPHSET